jgi:hypothetical protein
MANITKHLHHIIPRHVGGTDDPSNLIYLSVEEHAAAHEELYNQHGRLGDLVAWQCLSGKTTFSEKLRKELAINGFREKILNNSDRKDEWIRKLSIANTGKTLPQDIRTKISDSLKTAYSVDRKKYVPPRDPDHHSKNCKVNSEILAEGRRKSEKWIKAVTNPDMIKNKQTNSPKNKPITVDGVEYFSIAEAARCLNLNVQKLRSAARAKGNNIITNGEVFSRNPIISD